MTFVIVQVDNKSQVPNDLNRFSDGCPHMPSSVRKLRLYKGIIT